MSVHPVLADRPDVAALVEARADLTRRRLAFQLRADAEGDQYRAARAAHGQAVQRATLAGTDPPPPPPPPAPLSAGDPSVFTAEQQRLDHDEAALLRRIGPEVARALGRRERELLGEALDVVAEHLSPIVRELADVVEAGDVLRTALGAPSGPHTGRVDPLLALTAALARESLLEAPEGRSRTSAVSEAWRGVGSLVGR